jgi:hypothetical protein
MEMFQNAVSAAEYSTTVRQLHAAEYSTTVRQLHAAEYSTTVRQLHAAEYSTTVRQLHANTCSCFKASCRDLAHLGQQMGTRLRTQLH